ITHDLGVVARIANQVGVMYAGKVVETGSVEQIFRAPKHPYSAGLMSCIPVPGRTPPGGRLGTIPGVVPSLIGSPPGCAFKDRCSYARPECEGEIPVWGNAEHSWRCIHATGVPA